MSTTMKSFRLPEWTISQIEQLAVDLDVPQAAIVSLAIDSFANFGIAESLKSINFRDNDRDAYMQLIAMTSLNKDIASEIQTQMKTCRDNQR